MKQLRLLAIFLLGAFLLFSCKKPAPKEPPGSDDVFAVRDSIRQEMLLRIGHVQQEINRRVEAMSNRAYDADRATARRLNQKIAAARRSYQDLERQTQLIMNDSMMEEWIKLRRETELIILRASHELDIIF